ncbi:MAG: M48 family metalloprotease [Kiritimatiellae bacterium]|nr:M48 family metalloprotease [Kiritimatiellia bacterium]
MLPIFLSSVPGVLLVLALLVSAGCKTIEVVSQTAAAAGVITPEQAAGLEKSGQALASAFKQITPEQEYYIGRSIGATIVSRYKPCENEAANAYLNLLGQTLAMASDNPETFGGYHFLALDSDEVNAFAAPGGLIFVSRGMLRCCTSEDAVAAVLAHEIGHVQHRHGLQSISKGRWTSAGFTLLAEAGKEAARQYSPQEVSQLADTFENSLGDITKTLTDSGYARKFETQADATAVEIMQRVGYDPNALIGMLAEMKKHLKPGGADFAKTHPDPDDRIERVKKLIRTEPAAGGNPARQARFEQALGGL